MACAAVSPLLRTEIDEALVLAGLGTSDLDAEAWRRETLALMCDPDRGTLIVRDGLGRVCGLLRYRIVQGADTSPSLAVERLVAFDLLNPRPIADALIAEAVRLARLQDCRSLTLIRPLDTPSDTAALVLASGVADLHSVF